MKPLLAGLVLLVAAGCDSRPEVRFLSLDVEPSGAVARCQTITAHFTSSSQARYAVTSGDHVLAAGVTWGEHVQIELSADDLDPAAPDLTIALAAPSGAFTAERRPVRLDPDNTAPTARPLVVGTAAPLGQVMLDGSRSDDPEGDDLQFAWRLLDRDIDASLDGADLPAATLRLPPTARTVAVELTVADRQGASDVAVVRVRSVGAGGNRAPEVRSPGPGYELVEAARGADVEIRVDAVDQDGIGELAMQWEQVAGPRVESPARGELLSFHAPDASTLVVFDLVVTDGIDDVRTRVGIAVGGARPDAPPEPSVALLDHVRALAPVRLTAAATADPDTEDLWFEWYLAEAPAESTLGPGELPWRGWGVTEATLSFDAPGIYRVGVRVADDLGYAPRDGAITVDVPLTALQVHRSPVAGVDCRGATLVWAGPSGVGVRGPDGAAASLSAVEAHRVAIDASGRAAWFDGEDPESGFRTLARVGLDGWTPVEHVSLPAGANAINDLAIDPAPSRLGDVLVATNAGTGILDVSNRGCDEELGCWVGSPSTGYLHRPPSLLGLSSNVVDVVTAVVAASGHTVVHEGNGYWLIRLERRDDFHDFSHTALDLFSDREPQPIMALAVLDEVLYLGADPFGLVVRADDQDCGFGFTVPRRCDREATCTPVAAGDPPSGVIDLASGEAGLFIAAATGFHHYSPETARFAFLRPAGSAVAGTPTAVATCGDVVYLGTDQGLWQVALGEAD